MKMKKIVMLFAVLLVAVSLSIPAMAEEIQIVGTGSGAEILENLGKAFTKANPGATIAVPKSIGSGGAIKAAGTDEAKVGRVARGIKEKEKSYGLTYVPVAKLPIVIITHKGVGVKNLTPQQICDIYSGKITNWKEVGGKEGNIRVIRREDGDSSREVLEKNLPGYKAITVTAKSKETLSDPETIELTAKTPGTIAYGTYPNAKVADVAGLVEQINLRKTVLRDLDGVVHHVPNGEVRVASNYSRHFSRVNLNISVSYATDLDFAIEVINRVCQEMAEEERWHKVTRSVPQVLRVDNLGDSGIEIKIIGDVKPLEQWNVMGELRLRLKKEFDKVGIEIPWPHTKVYFGNEPVQPKKRRAG